MSQLKQPEPPNVRGLAIADAANELDVEPEVAPPRTPGGEQALRAARERRFTAPPEPVSPDADAL